MKRILSILILILISMGMYSQVKDTLSKKEISYGFNVGLNYCKFRNDTFDFSYTTKPLIGIFGKYDFWKKINLKGSIFYSVKGATSVNPYLKLENRYLDLNFIPQFRIVNDFYFQTGISYSNLLSSKKIIHDGSKWNGINKVNYKGYDSEVNFIAGLELKLQKRLGFEINYYIPASGSNNQNIQFALNFYLNKIDQKSDSYRKTIRNRSKEQINQLKEGTLLVRLKTSENKINALLSEKKYWKADTLKKIQDAENKKIIAAFNEKFKFCKVAFFYSNNSKNILERKFDNIFLNDSLQIDNSIVIDTTKSIFTAEFGFLVQDSIKYFSHFGYLPNKNWSVKRINYYYSSSTGNDISSLIIMNDKFYALKRPFPYYTRIIYSSAREHPEQFMFFPFGFINFSHKRTIEKMSVKLLQYYLKNNKSANK